MACTVICSDRTAGRNSGEDIAYNEISCAVTTDAKKIAAELSKPINKGAARVVFCTYQSLDKLRDAQKKHNAPDFDIALIDEAHRTTGYVRDRQAPGAFQLIHNDSDKNGIAVKKRLYMTATPRIYEGGNNKEEQAQVIDMNDTAAYGAEFYRLSFKKAVEHEMLCDYRVIALGISEDSMKANLKNQLFKLNNDIGGVGKAADDEASLALGAIALAVNGVVQGENAPGVLVRTIAYASNIRRSKWLAKAFDEATMKDWISAAGKANNRRNNRGNNNRGGALPIRALHLDGTSSALQRNAALRDLNNDASAQQPRLISNAQLFTEGVDVPALNAIAFLDPRQSKVDTIQAVGRVMRRAEGKTLGYIVVPVILPPDADLLEVLAADQSRFKSLGNVLRALQSHDERLYTELTDRLTFATARDGGNGEGIDEDYDPVQTTLLDADAMQAIYAQIAKKVGIAQRGKIIADAITRAIERAARLFKQQGVTQIIADTIGTPSDNEDESCKTAALLIANACIMHRRLEETKNLGGLTKIEYAKLVMDPCSALAGAWRTILEKDYEPVFWDATLLLENLPNSQEIRDAIDGLIQCAIENATTLNELGFDHAGPLYHKVLGTAQSDGAYYTKNLSGYLLAGLAFDENFVDWSDAAKVNKLRVIDPACGTGTLLMAALNIIKKRAAKAQNLTDDEVQALHKQLVENGIYGLDINKYSVQLAACNLTIGAPNTDYEKINLYAVEHGPLKGKAGDKAGDVRHGVLEKLLETEDNHFEILEPEPTYGKDVTSYEMTQVVLPREFDAVIYNPPFTDTSDAGSRYGEETQNALVERLTFIKSELARRDPDAANAIARMSVQPYFTPLANRLLSTEKGVLAEVVPATLCTAENARGQRQYLAQRHHIKLVVTSHDPKRINFSENTKIHECLIVGNRSEDKTSPTRFIQLAQYPTDVNASDELIDAIQSGNAGDLYSETLWPAEKVRAGNWSPVQWFNPSLANEAENVKSLPGLHSATKYEWGTTPEAFYNIFTTPKLAEKTPGNVIGSIDENIMQTLSIDKATHTCDIKAGQKKRAEQVFAKATRASVVFNFSPPTTRVVAIYSKNSLISSRFRPFYADSDDYAKVFVAFLNSSFGIIQMLNLRSKKLTYVTYKPSGLRNLMLPDPKQANLKPLLAAFEKVKDTPLGRLRDCVTDPSRKILDHAAAKAIGVDPKLTDQWRKWLSQEPTITNKPCGG